MVVRVGLVELQHGELGIVLRAYAFVAEVAVDLVDPVEAADDEALEVKLRGDAQKKILVERVVMRLEGPRRRAACDLLHHRRFHFKISALIEELPQRLQGFGALDEDFAAFEIREQVHVALAVAQLHVREAVELLRQRQHGLGEEGEPLDVHRQLAGAGAEQVAGDADVVAHVEELVEREALFADRVEADINLQPLALLLERGKAGLALGADGHDAPGNGHGCAIGLEILGLRLAPLRAHLGYGVRGRKLVGIRRLAQLLNFYQFGLAQIEKTALKLRIELHVSFF